MAPNPIGFRGFGVGQDPKPYKFMGFGDPGQKRAKSWSALMEGPLVAKFCRKSAENWPKNQNSELPMK